MVALVVFQHKNQTCNHNCSKLWHKNSIPCELAKFPVVESFELEVCRIEPLHCKNFSCVQYALLVEVIELIAHSEC